MKYVNYQEETIGLCSIMNVICWGRRGENARSKGCLILCNSFSGLAFPSKKQMSAHDEEDSIMAPTGSERSRDFGELFLLHCSSAISL